MNSLQTKDRLKVIRDKVEQGGRLNLDDGIFLYDPEVSLRADQRQCWLLQHQHALKPDECVRLSLSLLCVQI
jgi:hypothetical protein